MQTENNIIYNLKLTYHNIYRRMVSYTVLTDYDILIKLDDGTRVLYDDFDKSYRRLSYDIYNPSEESYGIEFGKRLTNLMYRKCITQYELAQRSGLSQSSISRYTNGTTIPSIYIFNRILSTLQLDEDEIRYLSISL